MADSTITWDLLARDRASQTVGRVGGSVEKLTQRVSRLAAAFGGAFALERAGEFALKMADQFELSRSRLETITKNIGGDFNAVSGQVDALDKRLAAFGFTNADVEGSVASLETATKNVPKALKDVALAADIARGRNISLEESTRILQRVETGHVSMLSRLGIPTIDKATGKILSQKQALDLLSQTYRGNASNFADTFAGKQEALRAELANSAAEIGVALLPAAVDLAHVIQDQVLPPVEKAAHFFEQNRKAIEPLVGLVIKLTLAYKGLKIAQSVLGGLNVGKAGAGAAEGALASGFSVSRPLPVFVVNQGGKFPGGPLTAGEEAGAAGGAGYFARLFGSRAALGAGAAGAGIYSIFQLYQAQKNARDAQKSGGAFGVLGSTLSSIGHFGSSFKDNLGVSDAFNSIGSFLGMVGKINKQAHDAATGTRTLTAADKTLILTAQDLTTNLHAQAKALAKTQTNALDLAGSQDTLRKAIHNMAVVAVGQSSGALKGNSDAALANRDALRGAVSSAEDYLKVLKQHGASAHHVATVEYGLADAIKKNADRTYNNRDAVHALLKQLGFLPGQIAPIVTAWNDVTSAAMSANAAEYAAANAPGTPGNPLSVNAAEYAANNAAAAAQKAHEKAGENVGKSFGGGYDKVINPAVSSAAQKAADAAQRVFDKAKSKMQADTQEIVGYFKQTKQELISTFGAFQTSGTDLLGASGANSNLKAQLKTDAAQMHTFARLWHHLADLNLDPRLLAQFSGPDYIPAMQELLQSGRKGIRQVNRLERQISHDAAGIARSATDDKYGKLIHDDLTGLPAKLSRHMARDLRHVHLSVSLADIDGREGRKVQQS